MARSRNNQKSQFPPGVIVHHRPVVLPKPEEEFQAWEETQEESSSRFEGLDPVLGEWAF